MSRELTIAIMQPYFIPYLGYFRLFAACDLFVIYDCVQFPRRGWVHRNRLVDAQGSLRWLTLPLDRIPRDGLIRDLRFGPDAAETFRGRLRPFRFDTRNATAVEPMMQAFHDIGGHPVDYIETLLREVVHYFGLPWRALRSSSLAIPQSYRGQDRILAIVERLGARRYINAPGGRELYEPQRFAAAGIELAFLPDYSGANTSVLGRILNENKDDLMREIIEYEGGTSDFDTVRSR
jgi:WbqC-like protein family